MGALLVEPVAQLVLSSIAKSVGEAVDLCQPREARLHPLLDLQKPLLSLGGRIHDIALLSAGGRQHRRQVGGDSRLPSCRAGGGAHREGRRRCCGSATGWSLAMTLGQSRPVEVHEGGLGKDGAARGRAQQSRTHLRRGSQGARSRSRALPPFDTTPGATLSPILDDEEAHLDLGRHAGVQRALPVAHPRNGLAVERR